MAKVIFKRIKKITPRVEQQLMNLQRACLPHDAPVRPVAVHYWWIGYATKMPVAFCLLKPSVQWVDAAYLARSGVLYLWRGRGLQKRMIQIRERAAKKLGYLWLLSDTTENPPSANSLARRGYQMYDPRRPWGVETTLYWRKRLK